MVGEAVSLEVGLLESAQWCRNGEYGRMWKKLDLRVGLWNPFPNTLQKESKNQSLRDRFQAKTKSSRCITCIIKNSYIYIYIYIYPSTEGQSTIGEAGIGRGGSCVLPFPKGAG